MMARHAVPPAASIGPDEYGDGTSVDTMAADCMALSEVGYGTLAARIRAAGFLKSGRAPALGRSRLFDFRRLDGAFDIALLFRRGQRRLKPEGFQPEFPAPALGVIKMLVFLVLDLLIRRLHQCRGFALDVRGTLSDERSEDLRTARPISEFAAPALGVIKMLVFLVLDLLIRRLHQCRGFALDVRGTLSDE